MKSITVLMCTLAAATAVSFTRVVYEEWRAFKLEHQKRYESELEDQYRMKIFARNKRKVARHNQLFALGLTGFSQALNKYSDLSHREFVTLLSGYNGTLINPAESRGQGGLVEWYKPAVNWIPPKEIDWRRTGAVTEVKDQNKCASCWAFSSTGALEGQHYLRTGRPLVSLSEQNLIDCSREYGNRGCHGGKMNNAFTYIKSTRGVDTENSYPYEAMDDLCRYNSSNAAAADAGYVVIPPVEWKLMHAVARVGPVSAAMCGSFDSFRHYSKGVYDDKRCTAKLQRHHAVLIVGYGRDRTGQDYWLIKNSWGRSWGLQGFGKMARNAKNLCGIASEASFPLVKT